MSAYEDMQDGELVASVLDSQDGAFAVLYGRYLKRIYNLVYRMVGAQEAEEVTQESFMQAYRNLPKFRGDSQFYTWLYRVASNTALQHLRKKGRRENRVSSFEDLSETAPGVLQEAPNNVFDDPVKAAENSELQRLVRETIETLPPNQRLVILLGPIRGLSYEEMARVLDASVPVVKARLHRARENLRERVASRYHGSQPPPDPDTSLLVKSSKGCDAEGTPRSRSRRGRGARAPPDAADPPTT